MNLEDYAGRFKFLIRDHGPQFTAAFDAVFSAAGIDIVTTAIQAPVMNAIQERWHRTVRTELLDRILVWNLPHLRRVLAEYEFFYNKYRPHRALGQAATSRSNAPSEIRRPKLRSVADKLAAARENNRFADRRIADLEARVVG